MLKNLVKNQKKFMENFNYKKCITFFMHNPYNNYDYNIYIHKYLVKKIVKPYISSAKVYAYFTNIESIQKYDFTILPDIFVIKGVHGWNMHMICHKNNFILENILDILIVWLQKNLQ